MGRSSVNQRFIVMVVQYVRNRMLVRLRGGGSELGNLKP
jgi:hypothetical protein